MEAVNFTVIVSFLIANIARNSCCTLRQIILLISSITEALIYFLIFFGIDKRKLILLKLSLASIFIRIILITTVLFVFVFISIIGMIVERSTGKQYLK